MIQMYEGPTSTASAIMRDSRLSGCPARRNRSHSTPLA